MTIGAWIDNVLSDVKHAARSLRRSPGFAAVAILALAIGIGGNTAIFSVIDATRTQAIPYRDPQQLMYLIGTVRRATVERRGTSYLALLLFAVVGLAACLVPGLRATRLDPVRALNHE